MPSKDFWHDPSNDWARRLEDKEDEKVLNAPVFPPPPADTPPAPASPGPDEDPRDSQEYFEGMEPEEFPLLDEDGFDAEGACPECGYSDPAGREVDVCPSCGSVISPYTQANEGQGDLF